MMLSDHGINHLPVAERGRIVGMLARTDLIRQQATSASHMAADIATANTALEPVPGFCPDPLGRAQEYRRSEAFWRGAGIISQTGARDLIDAYDLIAETRLAHQAEQIRRGEKPDNFLAPGNVSELDRNHLRDAFMIIKTMQSAIGPRGGGFI